MNTETLTRPLHRPNYAAMIRQLVPGVVLPGAIYFLLRAHVPVLVALAAASSVPALDTVIRVARGRRPTPVGLVFLLATALSVSLAVWLRSPALILGKTPVMTGLLGLAFVLSATVGRPLTRTLAAYLCTEDSTHRRHLVARWSRPAALAVFRTLSVGWGILLLASAIQQGMLAWAVSPGAFMAVEPPVRTFVTAMGVLASVLYVRRCQRDDPELGLLPSRNR